MVEKGLGRESDEVIVSVTAEGLKRFIVYTRPVLRFNESEITFTVISLLYSTMHIVYRIFLSSHYIGNKLIEPLFQKYCHICKFPHTYGSIFFRMPAFLSENFFHSCWLLGLMQAIHTSAIHCCFRRTKCHFSQNCCCNIFLFVA